METTTRQTVAVAGPATETPLVPITVASVKAAPDAGVLHAVGVHDWGKFDAADLANIQGSLEDTLRAARSASAPSSAAKLRLSVVIQRYLLASTNHSADALAAVSWCASDAEDRAIYQETFYATDSVILVGTLGGLKDSLHRRIVQRIVESALVIAQGAVPPDALPKRIPGTFETFEEATAGLPESIRSWGLVTFSPPLFIPGTPYVSVPWWLVKQENFVSCTIG